MESALKLFSLQGVSDTSIDMVAKDAKISKGLIYNYFESKEDLLRSVVLQGLNKFLMFFDPNHDGVLSKAELKYFIEKTFRIIQSDLQFWKLYFSVLAQPQVLKLIDSEFRKTIEPFSQILGNYFNINKFEDPEIETQFFGALLDGICIHYVLDPENFPIEKIKQKVIDLYVR